MRKPKDIIGEDALTQLIFEGYAVVPAEPTAEMRKAGKSAMPVEYDFASMMSDGLPDHPDDQHRGRAVRMVATGWAKETVDPASVWSDMLKASETE